LMRGFMTIALESCSIVAINVQMLSGNKVALLSLFGEYADRTVDIAVWCKTNAPPAMADRVMTSAYEFIWFLSPDKKPSRAISTASFPRGTFPNVFESGTASGHDASVHGAVFPLAVATHFIGGMSQSTGAVYEPFLGSGTTLIAAEQLGRKCYGMEISPQYCDVIVKRWETLTGRKATRETREEQ
jgi:DNA modification methylase